MTTPALFFMAPDGGTDTEAWQIELPLPPKGAGSNARGSWKWMAAPLAEYRAECARLLREANIPALEMPITVHLDFYYCRGKTWTHPHLYKWRPRKKVWEFMYQCCQDETNARESCKQAQDALQDAGIVPRDSRRYVRSGRCTIHGTAKEHLGKTGLVMTITGNRAGGG